MSGRQECGYDVSITAFNLFKNKALFTVTDINCVKVKYYTFNVF